MHRKPVTAEMRALLVCGFLFTVLLKIQGQCFNQAQDTACYDGEVYVLGPNQSCEVHCNCGGDSVSCCWAPSIDRDNRLLTDRGTNASIFEWSSDIGYGNFTCIRDNNVSVKYILILPQILPSAQLTSCDGCITVCRATVGQYIFSMYFNSQSPCELYFFNGTFIDEVSEEQCVKLFSNSSYYLLCLICPDSNYDIRYDFTIPATNIKDCSNSDMCTQTPNVTDTMSTVIPSGTLPTPTSSVSSVSSTFATVPLITPTISGASNNDAENNDLIIAVVVVAVVVVLAVPVAVVAVAIFHRLKSTDARKGEDNNGSTQINEVLSQLLNRSGQELMDAIRKSHPIIDKKINFGTLIPYLNQYSIFTRSERATFTNPVLKPDDKVTSLIESLEKKDDEGIKNFIRALNDASEHSGHAEILQCIHEWPSSTI